MKKLITMIRRYRRDVVLLASLLLIAAVPRLLDLGVFLTADEKNWIGRSYEFIRAFKDFRFNDMLQTTHPGVTSMWSIGVAVTAKMFLSHVPFSFRNLAHFAAAAQFPIAVMTTLFVPATYLVLRKIITPRSLAAAAALFIALDPWLIGYSRVAHVDALLAHFLFLAAISTIVYAHSGWQQRWLITSALLSGAALLTKAPAIFMVPFFWLVVLMYEGPLTRTTWHLRGRDFTMWLLIIAIMFVTIWPAILWVPNPEGNLLTLKRDLGQAAVTPHDAVEEYSLNPLHYLFTLLTRTTPVTFVLVLLLIVVTLGSFIRYRRLNLTSVWSRPLVLIAAYAVFFTLMMTLGAKKGDRYLLSVWPALNVLAVLGLYLLSVWLAQKIKRVPRQRLFVALALLIALSQGATIWRYHPYTVAYSNPLFPDNLSQELGWGEGLEQVGAWLSTITPKAIVASWYPDELAAYTSAQVAHINAHQQGKVRYVVLYRNMFGRPAAHYANDFIDEYYDKREPVFVAYVAGKEFAWVYEKWVFEQIVGELLPGRRVGQEIEVKKAPLFGVDIMPATYSGRATQGSLTVHLKEVGGRVIHEWRLPMNTVTDTGWQTLQLPIPVTNPPQRVVVELFAEGTSPKQAPTIRYTRDFNYRPSSLYLTGTASVPQGDLAVRLRYFINEQQVAEEDTKLFK